MMNIRKMKFFSTIFLIGFINTLYAQSGLEALLDDEHPKKEQVYGTFKSTRIINLQSVERVAPGELQFVIQHRFGPINGGYYTLFGFDQATIRFGFEYGLAKFLSVGLGRSSYQKTVDGFLKFSILRQTKGGAGTMPISLVYFSSVNINGLRWSDPTQTYLFSDRIAFINQLLIGSKLSERFSVQLSPTVVHKNLVSEAKESNTVFALGIGGRGKLTKRMTLNAEYIYRIPPSDQTIVSYASFNNALSVGLDIETGGHVFQLHVSNSLPMNERGFILEADKSWADGGIHFGFNITRNFVLRKVKK